MAQTGFGQPVLDPLPRNSSFVPGFEDGTRTCTSPLEDALILHGSQEVRVLEGKDTFALLYEVVDEWSFSFLSTTYSCPCL